jgi:vacuolar-type H+-ATPase subunit I/STV1
VIEFHEPPQTGFELRWALFGVRFRVFPSFFGISAVLAAVFLWPLARNQVTLAIGVAIDVACIFFAIVFTEFVQGLVYRSYGLRSTAVLQEFGGGIYPDAEPPTALQRIVAYLSNPVSSLLLFAIVHYSEEHYRWSQTSPYAGFAYLILWIVTLFWGIIGFLPIFPYPGGRVMLEVLNLISPRSGLALTLVLSILFGVAYIVYTVAVRFLHAMHEVRLVENVTLPANIFLAIFVALATAHNWQLLGYVRAQHRNHRTDDDEDRSPWEK